MQYWWVNQNSTYKSERDGGYLWAPKKDKSGGEQWHWQTMLRVQPGDLIFSYVGQQIRSVGCALAPALDAHKPTFSEAASAQWGDEGRMVEVAYHEMGTGLQPRAHFDLIKPFLPEKYSPLVADTGEGIQGYLIEVPKLLGELLIELLGAEALAVKDQFRESELDEVNEDIDQSEILSNPSLGSCEKQQLVKARRGQGAFKNNVRRVESGCRITGVSNPLRLIASHIKPWAKSSNEEKLDGHNGLLLAPHVDHLFDRGFISFADTGELLVSDEIEPRIMEAWGIEQAECLAFLPEQCVYLQYHREHVMKKRSLEDAKEPERSTRLIEQAA